MPHQAVEALVLVLCGAPEASLKEGLVSQPNVQWLDHFENGLWQDVVVLVSITTSLLPLPATPRFNARRAVLVLWELITPKPLAQIVSNFQERQCASQGIVWCHFCFNPREIDFWPLEAQIATGKLKPVPSRSSFLERSLFRSGDHGMDPFFGAFLGSTASKNASIVFLTDEDMLTK